MAEVSKNNKILKFEVSARLNKDDEVSIFATDHDFAGLPFKVNILKGSNTHNSVLSVMEDYGMKTTEQLVDVDEKNSTTEDNKTVSTIPERVDYPGFVLSSADLVPLGVGENGNLVHIELPDVLFVKGPKGSGKTQVLNTILQHAQMAFSSIYYVNDLDTLLKANEYLRRALNIRSAEKILIVSDGFEGMENYVNQQKIRGELKIMTWLVASLPETHAVLSVQNVLAEAVRGFEGSVSISHRTMTMGGSDEKVVIQGRGNASRLFVNGERIPDGTRIDFQTYLTEENWIEKVSEVKDHHLLSQQMSHFALAEKKRKERIDAVLDRIKM